MVWEKIKVRLDRLPSGQQAVARFLLARPREAAFLTAAQLGEQVGVSESTVIRLAAALGFPGFPELRSALQETLRDQLSALERLQLYQTTGEGGNLVQRVLRQDLQRGLSALASLEDGPIERLAEALCSASAIYLIGLRSARALVAYFGTYLSWFLPEVHYLEGDLFQEQVIAAREKSLFIGISFPRYTRQTVDCLAFAHDQGLATAAITDALTSPLAEKADYVVTVPCSHVSYIDSFVIPLGLLNALLLRVTDHLGPLASERLEHLEEVWAEAKIYLETTRR
ncbi:MAG: MurR/RpiR family transcriptional regulator [Synergistaceae bacterium]|jgi:DNA-binding MurR/RpiR family transcriptional regulator|nr:MurR/RpiR family transcriptional regulator [Synergistaceae bacterium]